jgi:biopolymer transport protein ExbB
MMWVVLLLGVFWLVLFIERTLYLHRGQIRSKPFIEGIENTLEKRRIVEALTLCEETPGPVAAVVKAALLHAHEDGDKLRFAVQEAAIVEVPSLERRLGSIAAIGQVTPLVGLLGTILGLITTFNAFMHSGQYATANALATGLWQALLVTAFSLVVTVCAHLSTNFLNGRVRAIVRDVEWAGNEIMRYLLNEYRTEGPAETSKPGAAAAPVGPTSALPTPTLSVAPTKSAAVRP